jgi:tetratricopeptide (TPR) repeat protein
VWLRARLLPLVGACGEPAAQQESFTSWRRFFESLAQQQPAGRVFEDLHWADEALLGFLEHLADWSEDVPLLLLCTARPELYEQHPTFGANARNGQRINLAPLTDEETAYLISSLLERPVLSAVTQRQLLERAGGNPFYAEEFVRLLGDRGQSGGTVEVPDSVQALIAARLDTLSPERKSLLQDAAVIGKVFWASALAEMAGRKPEDIEVDLHELGRKELLRSARTTSMEGEQEYGFWHALIRDVCYSQIPRAARAARHRAAAAWIERKAGERVEDLADVLAHHYLQALELVALVGPATDAGKLQDQARRYLLLAGERALPLNVASAEASLARALELSPAGDSERPRMLERWAQAAQQQYRLQEAEDALEEALALYRKGGETIASGRVLNTLSIVLSRLDLTRSEAAIAEAVDLLEAQPPGPELVAAYAGLAGQHSVGSAYAEALAAADRAIELAAELGLPEPARAVGFRGDARSYLGDPKGLDDLRRALSLALEQSEGRSAALQHNNLAMATWLYEGPLSALAVCREGIEFCERRGITEFALNIGAMIPTFAAECGLTDEALSEAGSISHRMEVEGDVGFKEPRAVQLRVLAERGAAQGPEAERLVQAARDAPSVTGIAIAFPAAALVLHRQGRTQEAQALVTELQQVDGVRADPYYGASLSELVRTVLAADDLKLVARLVEGVEPKPPLFEHGLVAARAQLAEAHGEIADAADLYREAAERWRSFGNVPERAYALLGQGRCLGSLGRADSVQPLREARGLFAAMGYKPALAQTEALLEHPRAAAS